jgi:FlaA1/EpsC-like NDP-sugar epimerase
MEQNPAEAFKNNTLATKLLAELAGENGTETFVFISTDKAVKPTSLMGATKRIAEMIIQNCDQKYDTKFVSVRFGNVLGSAGSVVPIFLEQIRRGGPVTVTHPDMIRYFMTIQEAVSLVLQAGAMGKGGEVFSLDMGEPMRIVDLAKKIIELAGHTLGEDMEITYSGVRPGEKIIEDALIMDEEQKTAHPHIYLAAEGLISKDNVEELLERLNHLAEVGEEEKLKELIVSNCENHLAFVNS